MAISDQLVDKGLPANLLAERTVLGAILLDSFHFFNVADLLQPDDFHLDAHRKIYRAMRELAEKSRVVSEGAGALALAAALSGKAGKGPIVAIVSGGNIDLKKFCELIGD